MAYTAFGSWNIWIIANICREVIIKIYAIVLCYIFEIPSNSTTAKRVYFFIGASISLPSKNTKSPTFRAYKNEDKKNRP